MLKKLLVVLTVAAVAAGIWFFAQPTPEVLETESYGLLLVIDGAHGGIWKRYADAGKLPNVKKIFMDDGVWVDHATTVFPTITGAGLPAALTGNIPGRHGIPSLYFFDRAKREYPVLYVALEAFDWNDYLSPKIKTVWEHFEGKDDTIAIGPALSRGADDTISFLWGYEYKPVEYRTKLQLGLRKLGRVTTGKPPARLTVAYNGWFDHMEHGLGATSPDMDEHYKAIDDLIGESVSVFNKTMDAREKKIGRAVARYVALVSDHGHQDIKDVFSLDKFVRKTKAARIVDKDWTKLFGMKLKGAVPEDFTEREIVVAAGEGHALLYLPAPVKDKDGHETLDWDTRPTIAQLRDYPFRGERIDVIATGVAWKEAVSFMLGKDWTTGAVHVFGPEGESKIEKKGEFATQSDYRYTVVSGKDPLKFAEDPKVQPLIDGAFHSADAWQNATYLTDSPDAVVMLYQAFDVPDRAPDLYLSAAPFISIGDLVDRAKSASKHGGLTKDESWSTVAFAGTGISKGSIRTARNIDVVPTLLSLLSQPVAKNSLDGKVLTLTSTTR